MTTDIKIQGQLEKNKETKRTFQNTNLCKILYFMNCKGHVLAVTIDNNYIDGFSCSFKNLSTLLPGFGFQRLNQNQIVSLKHIKRITKIRQLELTNGIRLKVSRKYWYKFKK